jgi:phenylacetate-coenzyme A ligase PaaK-like adenylate-forming protein
MEDYLYKFLSVYRNLPYSLRKNSGKVYNLLPRTFRYGKFYNIYLKRLNNFNSQDDIKKIIAKQNKILFDQVNKAIRSVKYYQEYPQCLSLDIFRSYPIINKEIIRSHLSDFLNPYYSNKRIKSNTGGSSGNPLEFFLEKNVSRPKEKDHFD